MRRELAIGLAFALGACASGGGEPPPLASLAGDREQPVLALFEHVLTGYFAGAGADAPTTCARLSPAPLSAAQETALIARFVRLAPAERCIAAGPGTVDAITGEAAQLVQIYEFACQSEALCSGWVAAPGTPATRYAMRFEGGAWRFDSDRRIIAE
ncbi:MAG TPA: hypothetical protein VI168_10290 [Croceibacterium sp.]